MCDDCCYGTQPSLQYTQADEMYSIVLELQRDYFL